MKVLLVTGSVPPMRCGVGDYSWKLAGALARRGLSVGLLTSIDGTLNAASGPDETWAIPSRVTIFPVMPHWGLAAVRTAWRVLREWRPDVVHIQYPTQGYGAGRLPSLLPILAALAGARVVRTWHEIPSGREKTFLLQALVPGENVVTRERFGHAMPPLARWLLHNSGRTDVPIASNIPAVVLSDIERRELRARYLGDRTDLRLIVYFGFLYRFKGADQLFDICDPRTDRLVFVGDIDVDSDYAHEISRRARDPRWHGMASLLGYLGEADIGRYLAAADAVVLPFRRGGDIGNGTIHAALLQNAPVVTTSLQRRGLDPQNMIYYAAPDDVEDMRRGLDLVVREPRSRSVHEGHGDWDRIADAHSAIYARGRVASGDVGL